MKHSTLCKIWYVLFSIPMTLKMKALGIKINSLVYSGGCIFISRHCHSKICIGKGCRFMNWKYGNLIGLNHACILATYTEHAELIIGDYCSFSGVSLWAHESIKIGNNVRIGANVCIMDSDQHTDDIRSGSNRPVVIEDNVWLGANVVVLKGVTIGRNSLIGAGSIVSRNIPENVIAAGNPCKVIRGIPSIEK